MTDLAKSPCVIELSTVYFCEGPIPHVIALKDCGLALRGRSLPALTALYGNQSKQDGFMAARDYAEKQRLQFTVIDFLVTLEHRINPGLMKLEELAHHDFLPFQRLSRAVLDEMAEILNTHAALEHLAGVDSAAKPAALLLEHPELVEYLADDPMLRHVKVIAHQAKPVMSERALNVGTVPYLHWNAIREATCRLNPTTRITLDNPALRERPVLAVKPGQTSKPKPAAARRK